MTRDTFQFPFISASISDEHDPNQILIWCVDELLRKVGNKFHHIRRSDPKRPHSKAGSAEGATGRGYFVLNCILLYSLLKIAHLSGPSLIYLARYEANLA